MIMDKAVSTLGPITFQDKKIYLYHINLILTFMHE